MNNDSLKTLHTALVDARHGYLKAAEDAEEDNMKSLFQSMIDLHDRARSDLHAAILQRGEQPDDTGSFMSTVHETVIAVRSAVTGLDRSDLSSFASGEERVVKLYNDAIKANANDLSVAAMLTRQLSALEGKISEMKRLAVQ